jgi:hypothetical protein
MGLFQSREGGRRRLNLGFDMYNIVSNPNYDRLKEQSLRLQAETKRFNAKADTIHAEMVTLNADHKIDLNAQNMAINDLNEKMTELLTEFDKFRDSSIIIKKTMGLDGGRNTD